MPPRNQELGLDLEWVNSLTIDEAVVSSKAQLYNEQAAQTPIDRDTEPWLVKAIQCIDLATLVGDETPDAIVKLCLKATHPYFEAEKSVFSKVSALSKETAAATCGAVCVYPLRVSDCVRALPSPSGQPVINIASVAAGFPSASFPLHTRLAEIYYAVAEGANEIDIVIDRSLVLRGLWTQLYDEVVQMRRACPHACLKVILSVSECGSFNNIYKASVVAMLAGADFLKTSTGKEAAQMTLQDGLVMAQAIKEFHDKHDIKVGLKPAGGVRTTEQALVWILMIRGCLGDEWFTPDLFRFGTGVTSPLLGNLATSILNNY